MMCGARGAYLPEPDEADPVRHFRGFGASFSAEAMVSPNLPTKGKETESLL